MTRPGLKAALKYGEKLPKFKSMAEAEKYFSPVKTNCWANLKRSASNTAFLLRIIRWKA